LGRARSDNPNLVKAQCSETAMEFKGVGQRKVVSDFSGGTMTSDGGAVLLEETEELVGVARRLAGCFTDHRDAERVEHSVLELVGQRVFSPALGYEDLYCARGEMENRIQEQQLCLFADRTSTATMRGNQIRLWFASAAYTLLNALRRVGLTGTKLARARCDTIRLKLLKIGAAVRVSVRRVYISMASSYPLQGLFRRVLRRVQDVVALRGVVPMRC